MSGNSYHNIVNPINRIVTHFKHSVTACEALNSQQKALDMPECKLVQSNDTRWTSTFNMVSVYLKNWEPLKNYILIYNDNSSDIR